MNLRIFLLACLFCISLTPSYSQNFPDEMYLTPDGRMMMTGGQAHTGLYNDSIVKSIYLTFTQPNYWTLLQQNYTTHTDLPATMVVDGVTYDSVGVRFKGQTSYSQTGLSQKKSFNITLDYAIDGQDLMGYETLNLNNCFQDESFIREVFYLHQIRNHIPAAKSAYVKLYINGANWGVYPNVQQLNKDYQNEWFLSKDGTSWRADKPPGAPGGGGPWGDGTAALNYLGGDSSFYKPYYTLKNFTKTNPWDDLVNVCDLLDNSSVANIPTVLPPIMDIDRTLWFLASEVLFSDDDSYIYKGKMDYYVYHEIETGRTVPLEFDGNSVMGTTHVNWSPFYNEQNANYPLMNKLFAVPQYRQRYLAHLRTLINEAFDTTTTYQEINRYKALIDTMVLNDPKKLYTYAQFQSEIPILKSFILNRRNFLLANSEVNQTGPSISSTSYYAGGIQYNPPSAMQDVNVRTTALTAASVKLYYATGIVGNFTAIDMFDDGLHNDSLAGDFIFGATIPGQAAGEWVRYYIEAKAGNVAQTVTYDPPGAEHNVYIYLVSPLSAASDVVINEIMASNSSTVTDGSGEYDDWIELYNKSNSAVDLTGYFLTDTPANLDKWEIPSGTIMQPNDYLIIWADEDSSQGPYHANFKLSGSGEQLYLINTSGILADSLSWGQQVTDMGYARVPNGTGPFVIQNPTFSANNNLTSLEENPVAVSGLSVYPNPAKEKVWIRIISTEPQTLLEINDMMGKSVYSELVTGESQIATSQWPTGIYFAKAGSLVKKILITK
jgi:hypothetical protein